MTKAEELLKMIDEGVPIQIACEVIGFSESVLTDKMRAVLISRQAACRAKILANLYKSTQKASSSPATIAVASKTYLDLTKEYEPIPIDNDAIETRECFLQLAEMQGD